MTQTRKAGPGRPSGSRNKSTVTRTREFREAISPEQCKAMALRLYSISMDEEVPYSEAIKAMTLMLKYLIHSADVELITDSEAEKPSAEAMAKAMDLISKMKGE